jgi:hypothetical protein
LEYEQSLRGLVGYIKYQTKFKNIPFKIWYFLGMTAVSGVVGLLAAWVTKDIGLTFLGLETLPASIAFVIGYAGGDFIENLFKIITGKTSLYSFNK